ncbi:MAG: MogA/MoaB family molybdenum cofactor biosynthesis protein [Clostridiales bacterium]|nr:MogA/MoaB family molybdenum cofactor biosynthesis protein [Clostridiales bacterium]
MKYKAAIITLSDSRYLGENKDLSKEVISNILQESNFEVVSYTILPDDFGKLKKELINQINNNVNLVVTTGGTGLSPKDITPEATKAVIDREILGIMEAVRANGLKYTKRAMLTRGVCGIKEKTIILNLPGSPKACKENLEFVLPTLIHGIESLLGKVSECGRK